jgi:branched-chain amino acid aminotransferase
MRKSAHIMLNGKILSSDANFIGANSELFNSGVFIKLLMRGCSGKMYFFEKHYKLLLETLNFLNWPDSIELSKEIIESDIFSLLQKNRIYQGAEIHLIVYPEKDKPHVLIKCSTAHSEFQINKKGVELLINHNSKIPVHNVSQYPIPALNSSNNRLKQLFELNNTLTLIINELDSVYLASGSSLFCVQGKTLLIPSLEQCYSYEIYRDIIIDIALKSGFRVFDDCSLKPNDLSDMDEIFTFDTVKGFTWISAYKERRYFNKTSALINHRLNSLSAKSIEY